MAEMSQRQFGELVGVTHRAVQKAIESGRITLNANGKIDPDVALAQWKRNTDESKRSFTDLSRAAVGSAGHELPPDPSADGDDDSLAGAKGEDPSLAAY